VYRLESGIEKRQERLNVSKRIPGKNGESPEHRDSRIFFALKPVSSAPSISVLAV